MDFRDVQMHGVVARRRVLHYGWDYGYESWKIEPTDPIPPRLLPVRERCAAFAGEPAKRLEQVLIAMYPPGAAIGWHRDAPMFGPSVVGISLAADCIMKFRRKTDSGFEVYKQPLERRSAYVIAGRARSEWQHSIPPVREERFSVTFRTVKSSPKK
jgi:alkylated DNA repair dioxygenase AlkB